MSKIEKIQIQGIRSYAETTIIEFFTPLTLIVGSNGAGKTTIIEALNYITTGDMPPNAKGAAFVFDPKVAGEQEVKGQVKLMMKDVSGHPVMVTRSLVSTQKFKKIECKSLENVINRRINNEMTSVSSKCADINREMITFLGVSKPVLDSVIFCHQDDSLWPLSDSKTLKTKFDDIFAATRYIKALEAIRKFRKEQLADVKNFKTELDYLKANKDKAMEIERNLDETRRKLEETVSQVDEIWNSMKPVETRLKEMAKIHDKIADLQKKLELFQQEKNQLKATDQNLRTKIQKLFQGTAQELERYFNEFETNMRKKEKKLQETEECQRGKNREQAALNQEKDRILVKHGKLEQEAERNKANIIERDEMIVEQAKLFNFTGFEEPPFNEEQVNRFMSKTKERYQKLIQDGKNSKQVLQEKIDNIQRKIDDIKKSLYQQEEIIRTKKKSLDDNQKKLRQVGHDLSGVDASAKKLQGIEKEMKVAEQELADTKASSNVSQWKTEVEESVKEKRQLDLELSRLRDEQHMMHLQSTAQAKLDMSRKEKDGKEDAIQKILDRHEEELRSLFGVPGPADTLKTRVSKFLVEKQEELKNMNTSIQKLKQKQSSKQAEKRMISDEITKLKRESADYRTQMKDICGEKDYNAMKTDVYASIEQAKSKCSQLAAFETIYKKYITTMEEKEKKQSCCPLCHRQFDDLKQMKNLVDELKDKIRRVPEKMRSQEEHLQRDEELHEQLQKLRSVKDNLVGIESNKLPNAQEKLTKVSSELEEIQTQIEELEDVRSVVENEECGARKMEPDLIMLEEHQKSLRVLDREISLQQSKIEGVGAGRSMQAVTNEISDHQDRVDGLDRIIERKRTQISQLESQLSKLSSDIHALSSEKLRLSSELQRRTHLEEQKAQLLADNMEHEREIKEAERQLQPIKVSLIEQENQYKMAVREQANNVDETTAKLNDIKGYVNKLKDKMNEIRKYVTEDRESVFKTVKNNLSEMDEKMKRVQKEKQELTEQIDELKEDLASQKVRARELQDNIQLFEIEENVSKVDRKISRVEQEQEGLGDVTQLSRELNNVQKRLDDLRKQKATYEGRLTGYEEEVVRYERELKTSIFKDAALKHRKKLIEIKTTELANEDLEKYYKALDRAIMKFHSLKMEEINKIIKEYWANTYKGNDIDTIEIRSDEDGGEGSSISARRTYNYKVVMMKGDVPLDMRGRCSAGQKVLACLIIRLALAETFCLNCGILALDEPTTNLDEENIESLANQLAKIIQSRNPQKNFQLVVITHDEHFVELLGQGDFVEHYYRVSKDAEGISRVFLQDTAGGRTT